MNFTPRNILLGAIVVLWVAFIFMGSGGSQARLSDVSYSQFLADVQQGRVQEVLIEGQTIRGRLQDGSSFRTHNPGDTGLVGDLLESGVQINSKAPAQPGFFSQLLGSLLPLLLLIGVWIWFMRLPWCAA